MSVELELRVAEIDKRSAGRGIVRIDADSMKKLRISSGDIVEIRNRKTTGAIAMYGPPEDRGAGIIRMDGLVRQNAGVGIGEFVKVRKADVKPATKVALAPLEEGGRLRIRGDIVRGIL
ncbi:MAG: AAA family ATPase, partial [Nitrososphaerota archaeon]